MREPVKATVTKEMMFRNTWEVELEYVLRGLDNEMEDLELQVHPYVHVEYDPQKELVYIRPKYYNFHDAYVLASPKAVRDRFFHQKREYNG